MGQRCRACTHKKRLDIDRACVRGQTNREIAETYGLSVTGVDRHRKNCLTRQLLKASEIKEVAHADVVLDDAMDLWDRALGILSEAEGSEDHGTALQAIREARGCLELRAKLAGQLQEGATVNILVSAEWAAVQLNIMDALEPFPDAKLAVASALKTVEAHNAA